MKNGAGGQNSGNLARLGHICKKKEHHMNVCLSIQRWVSVPVDVLRWGDFYATGLNK